MPRQKWGGLSVYVATILFGAASGVIPYHIHASELGAKNEIAPVASGGMVEGRMIVAEQLTLVIEKANGEVVRVPMPGSVGNLLPTLQKEITSR
ncbi:MAG: hypothetical protein KIT39_21230 [Nitrospirales bacterium]|nr:hypothetical protein [Nitrospirales bacterium]